MKEIFKKIKRLEEENGIKLYDEIMDDLFKKQMQLEDLRKSREKWREKYFTLKRG